MIGNEKKKINQRQRKEVGNTGKKRKCETKGHLDGESQAVGGGQQAVGGGDGGERGGHVQGVGGEGGMGGVVGGLVLATPCIRQYTSASVSIRQHTGGEGGIGGVVGGLVLAGVASDGGFDEEYVTYADVC